MISSELAQRIDRWLDGDLSQQESSGLFDALDQDGSSADYFADRALLHLLLSHAVASAPPAISKSGHRPPFRAIKPIALLACTLLVILGILSPWIALPTVQASAERMLKKTLVANRPSIDRRYNVRVDFERNWSKPSMLWVRQEQFVQSFETGDRKLVWGKSLSGDIWFTIDGRSVAVFQKDEIPSALEDICDLRTLDLRILLESLLKDYEFQRIERSSDRQKLTAKPKAQLNQAKFKKVEIEIESGSLLVRKVVLDRAFQGRTLATVSFELQQIATQADDFYHWKDYVDNDAEVLAQGTRRRLRTELLREFLQLTRISNYR